MVLVPPRPVGRHTRILLAKDRKDLLHLFIVDDIAKANLFREIDRNANRQISIGDFEDEVLTLLPKILPALPIFDDGCTMVGLDDLVADFK